jgi:hypothetical protein
MDHAGRRDLFSFPFRALPAVMDAIILAERQRSIPSFPIKVAIMPESFDKSHHPRYVHTPGMSCQSLIARNFVA